MRIDYHPKFASWLQDQSADLDVYGDVFALLGALEALGHELLVGHDECHPVVTSPYLYALRRTPPTMTTPYAMQPPVIRMLFAFTTVDERDASDTRSALMLVGGDKSRLGNLWYPPNIAETHHRLRHHALATTTTPFKARSQR